MSRNVIIKEDGVSKSLSSVSKINTALLSGGAATWIPEDITGRETLSVIANGEYMSEDFYGYSKVNVLVPGGAGAEIDGVYVEPQPGGEGCSVIGKGKDGKTYKVTVVNGSFVWEEVAE